MIFFFVHPEAIKIWYKNLDVLLIDTIYKTNRFSQPLINIYGNAGNNMISQLVIIFVSDFLFLFIFYLFFILFFKKKKNCHIWILNCVPKLLFDEDINKSKCFVTDRELAFLNSIDELFFKADHIQSDK